MTPAGRGVATFLMVAGVALFGVLTTNVAAFFVKRVQQVQGDAVVAKLDEVLGRLSASTTTMSSQVPSPNPSANGGLARSSNGQATKDGRRAKPHLRAVLDRATPSTIFTCIRRGVVASCVMTVDRSLGGRLDLIVRTAVARSKASLGEARALQDAGFASPSYVWAVRSVEVYVKEVMLLPIFLEQHDGDWRRAQRKIRDTFGSGHWRRAVRAVDEAYGPLDPMLTEDGKDVWDVWSTTVVAFRGDIVHGTAEASAEEAAVVLQWAGQMMDQLPLRLIVARKHPLHDFFVAALERARSSLEEPSPDEPDHPE